MLNVAANAVLMLTNSAMVSEIAYSVFFAVIGWLLCYILVFAEQYTDSTMKNKLMNGVLCGILTVDSVSMLLNPFFHHAFALKEVWSGHGELFYRVDQFAFYQTHLVVCYIVAAAIFLVLIRKIVTVPRIYQKKYFLVLLVLAVVMIFDGVYVFLDGLANLSIIGYAVGGFVVFYYSVRYVPDKLLKQMLLMVAKDIRDGILLFDMEGKCIYVNQVAHEMMLFADKPNVNLQDVFDYWGESRNPHTCEDFSIDRTIEIKDQTIHLKIFYHRLEDAKGHYVGSFWTLQNRTKEVEKLQKEHFRASHDMLTGLYNREYFYDRVAELLGQNPDEEFLMVCSDVKNFKLVNDIFGTAAGDQILIKMARELDRLTKANEIYARVGNDRFALLMKKKDFREDIFINGTKEVARIDSDMSYPLNIYVGVYEITDKSMQIPVMCDRAFMAINSIKGNYQTRIGYYNEGLRQNVMREQDLLGVLDDAMEQDEFLIYLQPQIRVNGGVSGAEALVRWNHLERGILPPGEFIEVFERNGVIGKLDLHIWELACRQLKRWKDAGKVDHYISVNISARDFYFVDVYRVFTELVAKYEIDPKNLKLEITESAVMNDLEQQLTLIQRLRDVGFAVEMDDFGSGYSSLNMLKDMHVDVLKIDMAFLGATKEEERSREILRTIVELSHKLGMETITEGVETKEQVEFLTSIGCDMFQGFYFAKPMPVGEFEEKYM